jgi:hypothetical protein
MDNRIHVRLDVGGVHRKYRGAHANDSPSNQPKGFPFPQCAPELTPKDPNALDVQKPLDLGRPSRHKRYPICNIPMDWIGLQWIVLAADHPRYRSGCPACPVRRSCSDHCPARRMDRRSTPAAWLQASIHAGSGDSMRGKRRYPAAQAKTAARKRPFLPRRR